MTSGGQELHPPADAPLSGRTKHKACSATARPRWQEGILLLLFFSLLPLALFWPVTFGGLSLVPFDILYQFEPWRSLADQVGVGLPNNELVADLVLENYAWKSFIVEALRARQLPLWNPYVFAGMPFLAAGQHSFLYPFSSLFLILPLWQAYGWFTVVTLIAAGLNMYVLLRVLGAGRGSALLGGLIYQGSGFLTISVVFQMIIAGAAWLPLVLAMLHKLAEKAAAGERDPTAYIPWTAVGGIALGLVFLAGHVEIAYYTLLLGAWYGLWHAGRLWLGGQRPGPVMRLVVWGLLMALVGGLLGAAQMVPLYELVRANFREGSATFQQVLGWAYPPRQIITFLVPDFWGNPARHEVFDIVRREWRPILTRNVMGQTLNYVAWTQGLPSWKNYVEAASYAGILPLILTVAALWYRWREPTVRFFTILVVVSLLFIFGTPLYALLYYGLPGWKQLHTPFRWVFPYTLAVAVLAALGWEWIVHHPRLRGVRRLGVLLTAGSTVGLLGLAAVFLAPAPWLALARRLMAASELTRVAFANDPALLISFQWRNVLVLTTFGLLAGVILWRTHRLPFGGDYRWTGVALAVVGLDLYVAAAGFNPAISPDLIRVTPPAVAWLQEQPGLWRFTTLEEPGRPVLTANTGMFYRLYDVRGYDSIILKHYVQFMEQVEGQGQLLYNRISPLFWEGSLDSALLDVLNVRFVVTTLEVNRPGWRPAYSGDVRIYENTDVLPRAYWLPAGRARWRDHDTVIAELTSLDPRREVWLDVNSAPPGRPVRPVAPTLSPSGEELWRPADVRTYTPNEVEVYVETDGPAVLVLADVWFPGWRAFLRPASGGDEREVVIWRADGALRAVQVPAGAWIVRWRYSPDSVKVGFFASFLGTVLLVLGAAYWLWGRIYQEQPHEHAVRRVAKNSLAPMLLQLLNKAVDTVFAAFMARILGPEGVGAYAFAVAIIWYFIIFTNFGLGTLLTRDVARDPHVAMRYVRHTIVSRLLLFFSAMPVLLAIIWLWETRFGLSRTTSWAIALLAIGLIPSNLADVLTALFRAHEKFEVPALITTVTTLVKVSLGAGVLLAGHGIIGLAATSAVTNTATLALLAWQAARQGLLTGAWWRGWGQEWRTGWDWRFSRGLLSTAFPLMINDFLSTAFFRMDVAILQPMKGDTVVGWYNVAYKFIDGLVIIPSSFTLALFPVISRYAEGARDALWRATVLSLRWLLFLAMPICVFTTRYADAIIWAFGGSRFLPHSATAWRLLIWFLPFSFINSLVHYVLIAVNQQRYLTRAFLIGVGVNLVANVLLIPRYSYQAAAINTVLSEIALLIPFYALLRRHVGPIPWLSIWWRPLVASGLMAVPLWAGLPAPAAIPLAGLTYIVGLLLLRAFTRDDWGVPGAPAAGRSAPACGASRSPVGALSRAVNQA
ncbi:MAG: oligosaccharide flippase family protein, partial [Ardenticatenia bacterium]|nr:oligosaccharide flippase family protein [Ardenticatenia bacterium]